jgi:hypothetical protein
MSYRTGIIDMEQVNVDSLSIKQRLERLGYTVERIEHDGKFMGMRVLKDGVCIHPDTPRFHVDGAEELCISLGG